MSTENMVSRVLVTGASGYIAAHVVKQLLEKGYNVRGTVRSLTNTLKVEPLKKLGEAAAGQLELVEADLTNKECWLDAVRDCSHVIHTASPFPMAQPRDENEVIKPAVEGTLSVLKACLDAGVKRVVLTSSTAAIGFHQTPEGTSYSEEDWLDISKPNLQPYAKSKLLAEKAAWDFMESLDDDQKFELAVINPGFVLGPVLTRQGGTSVDFMRRIMSCKDPMIPKVSFGCVDVRDVARAHVVAMTLPEAAGKRHILTTQMYWFHDMTKILGEEFANQGYKPSTTIVPRLIFTVICWFDTSLKAVQSQWDIVSKYNNTRMREVLKIEPIPIKESLIEMAYSLIENGSIKKSSSYKGRPNSSP